MVFTPALALERVTPLTDQVSRPMVALARVQVPPLRLYQMDSPVARLAESVPEMVWLAELVIRSVLETPVSAESAKVLMVTSASVVSSR